MQDLYSNLFVIIFQMFVKIVEPEDNQESRAEEEHRLLEQLTRIDRRLRSRTDTNSDHDEWKLWGQHKEPEESHDSRWQARGKEHLPIYNPNMEYFSEINTEDNDDDSLFDPQANILAVPRHQPRSHTITKNEMQNNKKDSDDQEAKQNRSSNSQSQRQLSEHNRIIKEMNYAYRKEVQPTKGALPPRSAKMSNSKGSLLPPKGQRKNSSANLRRSETTPQSLLNRVPSKEKYKEKQMIAEQSKCQEDPNEFKFHTFEVCLDNHSEVPTKSNTKCVRFKNQQQDKVSLECTFKPTILKKSAQMAKSSKNVIERLSTSGQPNKEQKKPYQHQVKQSLNMNRLEELSQPRRLKTQVQDKEEDIPSFRPSLSKKSLEHMSNCMYDVATRNQLWQREREEKIERMRMQQEREKEKRENCTHSPSLCQYRGDNAPNLSRFGREGMENYFERLSNNNRSVLRSKHADSSKQNKHSQSNMSKEGYGSKNAKKQKYEDAVKQLHSRIMGLKI